MRKRRTKCQEPTRIVIPSEEKSRVMKYNPESDENGRFIRFCDYSFHRGFIVTNPQTCESRGCEHYKKIYINPGRVI